MNIFKDNGTAEDDVREYYEDRDRALIEYISIIHKHLIENGVNADTIRTPEEFKSKVIEFFGKYPTISFAGLIVQLVLSSSIKIPSLHRGYINKDREEYFKNITYTAFCREQFPYKRQFNIYIKTYETVQRGIKEAGMNLDI